MLPTHRNGSGIANAYIHSVGIANPDEQIPTEFFFLPQSFGRFRNNTYLCRQDAIIKQKTMDTTMTKENALQAWKKAIRHKREATEKFECWLMERGIEGKVVTL